MQNYFKKQCTPKIKNQFGYIFQRIEKHLWKVFIFLSVFFNVDTKYIEPNQLFRQLAKELIYKFC
jgi:hypothetical protein